jgi:hypothetical protein
LTDSSIHRSYNWSLFLVIRSFAFVQKHRESIKAGVAAISLALGKYMPLGKATVLSFKTFPSRKWKRRNLLQITNMDSLSICQ